AEDGIRDRNVTGVQTCALPILAGAYIECQDGEVVALYRKQIDAIVAHGGIPILFQTSRLHGKTPAEKAAVYAAASHGYSHLLARSEERRVGKEWRFRWFAWELR